MTDPIKHLEASLDQIWEKHQIQYLAVIASCLTKKLDPKTEMMYSKVCQMYPYANLYNTLEKRQPGSFKIVGDGVKDRKIIVIFSQIYPGKMNSPNDSKPRRLAWFKEALDDIANLDDLKSICFLDQLSKDSGGNWSEYYQAIADFSQTVNLKANLNVSIGYTEQEQEPTQVKQISLINCFNPERVVTIDQIFISSDPKLKIVSEKEHIDLRGPKRKPQAQKTFKILDPEDQPAEDQQDQSTNNQATDNQPTDNQTTDNQPTDKSTEKPVKPKKTSSDGLTSSEDEAIIEQPKSKLKFKSKVDTTDKPTENQTENKTEKSTEKQEKPEKLEKPERPEQPKKPKTPVFPVTKLNPDWTTPLTDPNIHPSWQPLFEHPDLQRQLETTQQLLTSELESYGNEIRFLPEFDSIFKAFQLCEWDQLKVVILGQDPYPNELHAMGLSFSVPDGTGIPKSLVNIFKELKTEFPEYKTPNHGNLEEWAKQGVLLLNSSLTIRGDNRNSHQSYWSGVTDLIIESISDMKSKPIVFMLWGNDAKKKKTLINSKRHYVLEANHPSPLSAHKGFMGCDHFKLTNQKLESLNLTPINWQT